MTLDSQQYAYLADHAYDRQGDLGKKVNQVISVGGVEYRVLAHSDRASGYQGTIYQQVESGAIVVAHRGTEFDRQKLKDLVIADGAMVASRANPQAGDAIELTRQALVHARSNVGGYTPPPQVSVTGHSLGGTLAQVSAHHFDLKGETFNAYGAVSLNRRIPEGGNDVINHVMGHDMVAAGSPQYGSVRVYANQQTIDTLREQFYDNDRSGVDIRRPVPAAINALNRGSHDMHNFLPIDGAGKSDLSILKDPSARRLAAEYDPMIDKYRADVNRTRAAITIGVRGGAGLIDDAADRLRGPLEPGEPARREEQRRDRRGASLDAVPETAPDMRDENHQANGKYRQAYAGMLEIDRSMQRTPDGTTERVAAALTAEGAGLREISRVALNRDGTRVAALDESGGVLEARQRIDIDIATAAGQSVKTSTSQWQENTDRLAQERTQRQTVERDQPALQGPTMA